MTGFLNALEAGGNKVFFAAALQSWNLAEGQLMDRVHDEWFWHINAEGKSDEKLSKVSEWKGPYHVTRACLEAMKHLRRLQRPTKEPIQ